jgi:uncharacterized protein YdhG (YjbR/CyaY superfamily)
MSKAVKMSKKRAASVAEYIRAQPKGSQRALRSVRRVIRKALPGAEEVISYGIPAYRLHGYVVIYFAGWREHYSLYPVTARRIARLKPTSASYEVNDKGTIRFPLAQRVPIKFITDIARVREKEVVHHAMIRTAAKKKR